MQRMRVEVQREGKREERRMNIEIELLRKQIATLQQENEQLRKKLEYWKRGDIYA